jgi:hypothetical protein
MPDAWLHVPHMSRMVQIRNMPEELHRQLGARAAMAGLSLSDYLIRELQRLARYPTIDEWRRRLTSRRPVDDLDSSAAWVREERDGR